MYPYDRAARAICRAGCDSSYKAREEAREGTGALDETGKTDQGAEYAYAEALTEVRAWVNCILDRLEGLSYLLKTHEANSASKRWADYYNQCARWFCKKPWKHYVKPYIIVPGPIEDTCPAPPLQAFKLTGLAILYTLLDAAFRVWGGKYAVGLAEKGLGRLLREFVNVGPLRIKIPPYPVPDFPPRPKPPVPKYEWRAYPPGGWPWFI